MNIGKLQPIIEKKNISELKRLGIKVKDKSSDINSRKVLLKEDAVELSSEKLKTGFWSRLIAKFSKKTKKVSYYPNSNIKQSEEIIKDGVTVKLSKFNSNGSLSYLETFDPKTNKREIIKYIGKRPEHLIKYGDVVHYSSRAGKNGGWFEERYFPEQHKRVKTLEETVRHHGEEHEGVTKKRVDYDNGDYEFHTYEPGYIDSERTSLYYEKAAKTKKSVKYDGRGAQSELLTEQFDANGNVIKSSKVKPFRDGDFRLFDKYVDSKTGNIIEKEFYPWGLESWVKNPMHRMTVKDKDGNIIKEIKYDINGRVLSEYTCNSGASRTTQYTNNNINIESLKKKWSTGNGHYSTNFLNGLEEILEKLSHNKSLADEEFACLAKEFGVAVKDLHNLKSNNDLYKKLIQKYHPDRDANDEVRHIVLQILNNLR